MNIYTVTLLEGTRMTAHGPNKRDAIRSLGPHVKPADILSVSLLRRNTPRVESSE